MKTCTKCGIEKELGEFYPRANAKDGRRNDCIACQKARTRAWSIANRPKANEAKYRWKKANDYNRRWAKDNPEKVAAIRTRAQQKNPANASNSHLRRKVET